MSNSPWHHEVVEFADKLCNALRTLTEKSGNPDPPPLYGISCEHKHSCSVLLARVDQFSVDMEEGEGGGGGGGGGGDDSQNIQSCLDFCFWCSAVTTRSRL